MSLNWNIEKIQDWEIVCADPLDFDKLSPVTNEIIWRCMACCVGSIRTDKEVEELWWRVRMLQRLDGAEFTYKNGRKLYLTKWDIADHKGLETNVTTIGRRTWLGNMASEKQPGNGQEKSARFLHAKIMGKEEQEA